MLAKNNQVEKKKAALAKRALARWAKNPEAFAKEALGVTLWRKQIEILRAVRDHDRVTIRSGHKTGKTTVLAVLALWFALFHFEARVILTASSTRQVESAVWREIKKIYARAKFPIGGELRKSAAGGLRFSGSREIFGFATKDTERMAGFSSPNMLFICDEASGIEDEILEAIQGNSAGGAKIVLSSNPTKSFGVFYESFKGSVWHQIAISSWEAAKYSSNDLGRSGKTGLAGEAWCKQCLELWGENDPRYKIRVLGVFVDGEDALIIPKSLVREAQSRWEKAITEDVPLWVGVDLARFGSDLSSIALRKGKKIIKVRTLRKIDGPKVLEAVVQEIRKHSGSHRATVVLDVTGIGQGAAGFYRSCEDFDLIEVDNSSSPNSEEFAKKRDEVWVTFSNWLKSGGALPPGEELAEDASAPMFELDERNRVVIESKKRLRKRLKRSTDRADSCALACYEQGDRVDEGSVLDGFNYE